MSEGLYRPVGLKVKSYRHRTFRNSSPGHRPPTHDFLQHGLTARFLCLAVFFVEGSCSSFPALAASTSASCAGSQRPAIPVARGVASGVGGVSDLPKFSLRISRAARMMAARELGVGALKVGHEQFLGAISIHHDARRVAGRYRRWANPPLAGSKRTKRGNRPIAYQGRAIRTVGQPDQLAAVFAGVRQHFGKPEIRFTEWQCEHFSLEKSNVNSISASARSSSPAGALRIRVPHSLQTISATSPRR